MKLHLKNNQHPVSGINCKNNNNNNSNNNAHDIRGNRGDNDDDAKYLPSNSVIDFYSPNKSSEFLARCKTKNYEMMGIKRPETAPVVKHKTQHTKLTSHVISHLDPRLHKYQTEVRLIEDRNQLEKSAINNSFLVNVNTQSYSHSPSGAIIFKRRPSSANNLAMSTTGQLIDRKNNTNNNNSINNDYIRRHSEGNRNLASIFEVSYSNEVLKSDAASSNDNNQNQTAQYPAVTSMSHKSIIGKTRVSSKQVKLSKNRPLTSPDGFSIYY